MHRVHGQLRAPSGVTGGNWAGEGRGSGQENEQRIKGVDIMRKDTPAGAPLGPSRAAPLRFIGLAST